MSQMLKSSGSMAFATLTSRILGMVREMVYARFMGAGMVAGAFTLAFQIPNLFRRLLGEGALTAAFIPIFKEKERTTGPQDMWRAANAVISGLIAVASVITVLAIAGISVALLLGAGHFEEKTVLMLSLLRIMFPYMLLICLTAIFMGILNARGHFFIPAAGAIIMNLVMIASVYFLAPRMGTTLDQRIFALAFGVLVAGVAQAAFQLPTLHKEGFSYHWVTPWRDETVRRVVQQMIPGAIGVAAFQINVLLTGSVAFCVDPSIVARFNYAVRLMELPQGMFGISLATFLLPMLSGLAAEKKFPEFRKTLGQGIDHLVFANLIATVILCVQAEPIIRLLFQYKVFLAGDTTEAAIALAWLAPGLIAFSLVNILARAFYALGDTKTPMKISIFCLVLNLIISVCLVWRFRQGGLAFANSLSAIVNVSLLFYALRRKLGHLDLAEIRENVLYLLVAAGLAGLAAWQLTQWWGRKIGHVGLSHRLGEVFVPMLAAGVIYWGVTLWLKVPSAYEIGGLFLRKASRK